MKKYLFLCLLSSVFWMGTANAVLDEASTKNLTVDSLVVEPSSIIVSADTRITARVSNNGTETINISELTSSKLEDFPDFTVENATTSMVATTTETTSSSNESLLPGQAIDFIYNGHFGATGTKALVFNIDYSDKINESNEADNAKTVSIAVNEAVVIETPQSPAPTDSSVGFRISGLINGLNFAKIMLSWKTNQPATSELYYRKNGYTDYLSVKSTTLNTTHKLETAALAVGDYEYHIKSTNAEGKTLRSQNYYVKASQFSVLPSPTGGQTLSIIPKKIVPIAVKDTKLYNSIKGKIILRVQKKGEAYYVNPLKQEMYSLGRPDDAFLVMRQKGIGITNANLDKLGISLKIRSTGPDQDLDGLSDMMEDGLGTDKSKKDTDGDKHTDKSEVEGGFNPTKGGGAKMPIDNNFANAQSGKIFLATERHGEAWYVNPGDKKRYFLGRPADAFAAMRGLGVGISEGNFGKL